MTTHLDQVIAPTPANNINYTSAISENQTSKKTLEDWFQENQKDMIELHEQKGNHHHPVYYYYKPANKYFQLWSSHWNPPHYFVVSEVTKEEAISGKPPLYLEE